MNKTILFLSCIFILAFGREAKAQKSPYAEYTPKFLANVPFETLNTDFEKRHKKAVKPENLMSFRYEYTEKMKGDVKLVTYYFMGKGVNKLYEYIIDYTSDKAMQESSTKLLGAPNNGDEWAFVASNGIKVKAWSFENTLVIAASLPGSEWDETK